MLTYKNKTILLTGPSSGIGKAMALQLAGEDATLLLASRSADRLEQIADACRARGSRADVFPADLSVAGAGRALFDRITDAGHHVDILINNAGFGKRAPLQDIDVETLEALIGVNVTNVVSLCRLCLPSMIERGGGGILNISSTAAFQPLPYLTVYAASKAFIRYFSFGLHAEVSPHPVHVTCLTPGPTATSFGNVAEMPEGFYDTASTPERVARVGLAALRKGRMEATVGLIYKAQGTAARLAPHGVSLFFGKQVLGDGS